MRPKPFLGRAKAALFLCALGAGIPNCSTDPSSDPGALAAASPLRSGAAVSGDATPVRFELTDDHHERAIVDADATRGVSKPAHVALPERANGTTVVEDATSHLAVTFALRDASDAPIAVAGGIAMYRRAFGGADVLHRVHAEGVEDYVDFQERPAREVLHYDVDVSRVAGLRLVGNTLEMLDQQGAPRLRVAPPYVVDARGERHAAMLSIDGCAYDADPSGPWGRPITPPRAPVCTVRVAWEPVTYPAIVDPNWSATGSMAKGRAFHTATVLASGKVLMAGGIPAWQASEVFDPNSGTFAATGTMVAPRVYHASSLLSTGSVLVTGGYNGSSIMSSAEIYDPAAGTFTATVSMAAAREYHTSTLLPSGRVLITGGHSAGGTGAELFEAGTFVATAGAFTSYGLGGHTATLLGTGKVLIAGASPLLYDPASDSFTDTGAMHQIRANHTATLLTSGNVLVAGGSTGVPSFPGTALASAEIYDVAGGTFGSLIAMTEATAFQAAALLGSGQVLIAGGGNASTWVGTTTAQIFDPIAGTFSAGPSMAAARHSPTATLLGSGNVLVAGGSSFTGATQVGLSSAELYCVGGSCPVVCIPKTCSPGDCGTIGDGCGGTLPCGSCGPGQSCVQYRCTVATVDGGGGTDSGLIPDSGIPTTDAGTNPFDAGASASDSGSSGSVPSGDAGSNFGTDAGELSSSPSGDSGGCGCRTASPRQESTWVLFGVSSLTAALLRRRNSRRTTRRPTVPRLDNRSQPKGSR
jgi:hypothetical protein